MKPFIQSNLFFFIGIHHVLSQDSMILISARMFDGEQKIVVSAMNRRLFKEGRGPFMRK